MCNITVLDAARRAVMIAHKTHHKSDAQRKGVGVPM